MTDASTSWRDNPVQWVVEEARLGERRAEALVGGPARAKVIVLLACVLGLDSADKGATGSLAAYLEAAFHIGNVKLGLLIAVSSLVGAVATLPMGVLADRTRRVRTLAIVVLVWTAAELASGLAVSYLMLLLIRIGLGLVTAAAGPMVASLVGDLFPPGERGRIYGFILVGELVGAGIGLVVAGDVATVLTWRGGYMVLAIPSVVLAWFLWRTLPEPARGGQSYLRPGAETIPAATSGPSGSPASSGAAGARAASSGSSSGAAGARAASSGSSASSGTSGAPGAGSASSGSSAGAAPERRPGAAADKDPGRQGSDDDVLAQVRSQGVHADPGEVIEGDPTRINLWDAVKWVLRVRTNVALIVASALGYFFLGGVRTFAVIFVRGWYRIGQASASSLIIVIGVGAVVGVLVLARLTDAWIHRGRFDARMISGASGYILSAAVFIPALFTRSLAVALPLIVVAAFFLAGANPPVDAARLDVIPSRMWGRAEAIRTLLRQILEAFAPLIFGYVATALGGNGVQGGFGAGLNASHAHVSLAEARGLDDAFLIMLLPLAAAGVMLLVSRHRYGVDVASAGESEERTKEALAKR